MFHSPVWVILFHFEGEFWHLRNALFWAVMSNWLVLEKYHRRYFFSLQTSTLSEEGLGSVHMLVCSLVSIDAELVI